MIRSGEEETAFWEGMKNTNKRGEDGEHEEESNDARKDENGRGSEEKRGQGRGRNKIK